MDRAGERYLSIIPHCDMEKLSCAISAMLQRRLNFLAHLLWPTRRHAHSQAVDHLAHARQTVRGTLGVSPLQPEVHAAREHQHAIRHGGLDALMGHLDVVLQYPADSLGDVRMVRFRLPAITSSMS